MLRRILASRSSLLPQNYIQSHLSLGVCLIFGCLVCLWMLFLVSNAKTYPGFTELASLAKSYLITLVNGCLSYFRMLSLSLDAILGFERWTYSGLTELASLANYIYSPLSLGVGLIFECLACLWMLCLVSNAKTYPGFTELAPLAKFYLITLVVRCLPYFPILRSLDAILAFEC